MQTATVPQETLTAIEEATVSVTEASRLTRIHPDTIRRWIKKNILPATRFGEKGMWFIKITDLAQQMGIDPGEISRDSLNSIED